MFVVVKVTYDYYRFEDYLGIFSKEGRSTLDSNIPVLSVCESKKLGSESSIRGEYRDFAVHYMLEGIINE